MTQGSSPQQMVRMTGHTAYATSYTSLSCKKPNFVLTTDFSVNGNRTTVKQHR